MPLGGVAVCLVVRFACLGMEIRVGEFRSWWHDLEFVVEGAVSSAGAEPNRAVVHAGCVAVPGDAEEFAVSDPVVVGHRDVAYAVEGAVGSELSANAGPVEIVVHFGGRESFEVAEGVDSYEVAESAEVVEGVENLAVGDVEGWEDLVDVEE